VDEVGARPADESELDEEHKSARHDETGATGKNCLAAQQGCGTHRVRLVPAGFWDGIALPAWPQVQLGRAQRWDSATS
jgi:hypothetical protein